MKQAQNGFLISLIYLLSFAAYPAQSPSYFPSLHIEKALKSQTFSVSKGERKVANNLAKVYEVSEKGYINTRLAKKVLKESRSYSVFHVYKDWLISIVETHSNKSVNGLKDVCNRLARKTEKNMLKAQLLEKSRSMCFHQYLRLLSKQKPVKSKLEKEIPFFSRHAKYIAEPSNVESLNYFFSRFEKESAILAPFSKAIEDHYIKADSSPPKSLLQYMEITPRLTRHIQIKGLEESSSQTVLYLELKKLIDKAFEAADKKASKKKVAKLLSDAVNYYQLSYDHLPQGKSDRSILRLGKSLSRRAYYSPARKAFNAISSLNPKDENAIFETMWTWLTQEDYEKAYSEVIAKLGLEKNYAALKDDRLQFWTGYTLKRLKKETNKEVFENLVNKSALNYYSILASKFLTEHYDLPSEQIYFKLANNSDSEALKVPSFSSAFKRSVKRFRIWGSMDFKPLIALERRYADQLTGSSGIDESLRSAYLLMTAAALKEEENYLESFKLVYTGLNNKLINLDANVLGILFPKPYIEEVSSVIKTFDPLIALSLMRQESAFNRRARSWVGARGLMQLMPATARMYWRGIKTSHLYNPKINIKIGSKYLSNLLKKYENNLVFALSAYNAGESRVKEWKKEYFARDISILHNIENIPFPETRKYVKLIFRNLFFYKMMDEEVEVADSKKVNEIFDIKLGFNAASDQ